MVSMAATGTDVFSLTSSELGRCHVLTLRGELDEVAAPIVGEAIEHEDASALIVDLTGLEFICSAGLHVLLRGRAPAAIVCPPGNVARVLGIVRADKATRLYDDLDAAHEALCASLAGVA
jgi:anti-anti-sigma factor